MTWLGENPYCIIISRGPDDSLMLDLDEAGWATNHAEWLRTEARWFLVRKKDMQPVLWMRVHEGEQPYYTARHTGVAGSGGSTENVSYGIGKKRADGHVDRLWILPNGAVTLGDDVDEFALELLRGMR